MPFHIQIPYLQDGAAITINEGSTAIFVGANGSGKTRLAVLIEKNMEIRAHRISAHRSLNLNVDVAKIGQELALSGLRTGNTQIGSSPREFYRWQNKAATKLLDDFDYLIQALFAEQANTALETHKKVRSGIFNNTTKTDFEKLAEIWGRLLPHRHLDILGDSINVHMNGTEKIYKASEMSDGERAIFYMIGQVLVAAEKSLLIFDEPELHIHRAIMGKLWDELEAARPDCAFVLITHDLEFAASRVGQKFVIRDFTPEQGWLVEPVPDDTGFDEEITTLILGSRKPILFVEGAKDSLDRMIYRACYPDWTVIPRDSCEQVIHAVATMRANASLTRLACFGIVDADDHDATHLATLGVATLPVSEIENLILLPDVSRAILEKEGYSGLDLDEKLNFIKNSTFARALEPGMLDRVVARHCRRRIDRSLKKIDLSSAITAKEIAAEYKIQTSAIDIISISAESELNIRQAISHDNLPAFLRAYDDKGFLAIAARYLKSTNQRDFVAWFSRVLRNDSAPNVVAAIRGHLPLALPQ